MDNNHVDAQQLILQLQEMLAQSQLQVAILTVQLKAKNSTELQGD